ncbi:MAG: methylated-DNA--[protein]-cysteine S-methyltransferase [Pseudomonadota bacterium]
MSTKPDKLSDFDAMGRVIDWIARHRHEQPTVSEMANVVGFSSAHFSRVFRRWAGVSPQKFLAQLTLNDAREHLRNDATVESAAWASGLSGSGRLHDLFVTVDAVSPGEFRRRGEGLVLRVGFGPTRFGEAMLVTSDRGIVTLRFCDDNRAELLAALEKEWPRATLVQTALPRDYLASLVDGKVDADGVRLLLAGTQFQLKVWQALLALAPGQTAGYADIAREIGAPNAVRAVGNAVGANRIACLIPCHRVLRSNGALGGYRWGLTRKRCLLVREAFDGAPSLLQTVLT